jgi:hypothetical protein
VTLRALCFAADEPRRLAGFWAAALGWPLDDSGPASGPGRPDGPVRVVPTDGTPFDLWFEPAPAPKAGKNRVHLDLVSESPTDQAAMVDRLVALGAAPVDIGQPADADHVVLADPEGNELCIVVRGEFLATTGVLGAVVFEPATRPVGPFWSEATGWPLVFDDGGDTAIRAPDGRGPFVAFGPPPAGPPTGGSRLTLAVHAGVADLLALGARATDRPDVVTDPDGNELRVLTFTRP